MANIPSFMELAQNATAHHQYALNNMPMSYYALPPMDFAYHHGNRQTSEVTDDNKMLEEIAQSLRNFSSHPRSFQSPGPVPSKHNASPCFRCGKPLSSNQKNVIFEGNLLHPHCFTCTACNEVLESTFLQIEGKPYCQKDYTRLASDPKVTADLSEFSTVSITSQPAKFQVANYNIHPPPSLTIDTPSSSSHTVYMSLVEVTTKRIVQGGFQTGDVRVLRSGQQTLYFTGLKLSKMGPIKEELHIQNTRQLTSDFCIQFKIGSRVFFSTPFKLVSSCSQLPKDIREYVRPPKKSGMRRSRSNQDPSSEEGSPSGSPQHSFQFTPSQEIENATCNNNNATDTMNTPTKQPSNNDTTIMPAAATEPTPTTTRTESQTVDDLRVLRQELEVAIQRGEADAASQYAFKLASLNKRRRTE